MAKKSKKSKVSVTITKDQFECAANFLLCDLFDSDVIDGIKRHKRSAPSMKTIDFAIQRIDYLRMRAAFGRLGKELGVYPQSFEDRDICFGLPE